MMNNLDTTATINIDSSDLGFGQVLNHARHDPDQEHSNKDIDPEFTKYDIERHFDGKQWTSQNSNYWKSRLVKEVKPFIKKYNNKLDDKHKYRAYRNADDYLKRCKGQYDRRVIATLGNEETIGPLFDVIYNRFAERSAYNSDYNDEQFVERKTYDVFNQIFSRYVDDFNKNHDCLEITDYVTNLDEKGAPHMHYRLMQYGVDKKGKPILNMTRSIKKDMHLAKKTANNTVMVKFRKVEDSRLVDCANRVFKDNELDINLNLIRVTDEAKKMGLSMDDYKAMKQAEELINERDEWKKKADDLQAQVDKLQKNRGYVSGHAKRVNHENHKLKDENKVLHEKLEQSKKENKALKADNKQIEPLQKQVKSLNNENQVLHDENDSLKAKLQRVANWFKALPKHHLMKNGLKMLALHNNAENTLRRHGVRRMVYGRLDDLADKIESSLEKNHGFEHGLRHFNNATALSRAFDNSYSFDRLDEDTQNDLMTLGLGYYKRHRGQFAENQERAGKYVFESSPVVEMDYKRPEKPVYVQKDKDDEYDL